MQFRMSPYKIYIQILDLIRSDTLRPGDEVYVEAPLNALLGQNQRDSLAQYAADHKLTITFEEPQPVRPFNPSPTEETSFYGLRVAIQAPPDVAYRELVEVAVKQGWAIDTDMFQYFVNNEEVTDASTEVLADEFRRTNR